MLLVYVLKKEVFGGWFPWAGHACWQEKQAFYECVRRYYPKQNIGLELIKLLSICR